MDSRDTDDIADDDNVVWIADLAREAVALAYIRRNQRKRALARERKAVTRIKIEDGEARDPVDPRDGSWSSADDGGKG